MRTPHLHKSLKIAVVALAAVAGMTVVTLRAQTNGEPAKYTAAAFNVDRGSAGNIEIVVNRWSTDAQRDRLMDTLRDSGEERMLTVLQDLPRMGYFRWPNSIGVDIHFARRAPLPDGGQRVTLITDRWIGYWEAANQPPSIDYPFTLIELGLNADGEGEGKMSIATKLVLDKKTNSITREDWDLQPVMLTQVKQERVATQH
jgi:hypothetical protein